METISKLEMFVHGLVHLSFEKSLRMDGDSNLCEKPSAFLNEIDFLPLLVTFGCCLPYCSAPWRWICLCFHWFPTRTWKTALRSPLLPLHLLTGYLMTSLSSHPPKQINSATTRVLCWHMAWQALEMAI